MDERAAFEANIDANPLEATNHLVYADWLDEHGEHDEAAFRRAMGEWMSKKPFETMPNRAYAELTRAIHTPNSLGIKWRVHPLDFPSGVDVYDIDPSNMGGKSFSGRLGWDNYRDMEEDFRRSFISNRQHQQPEQLSRISHTVRKMRKR